MNQYTPPFTITTKIIKLISQVSETLGQLSILEAQKNSDLNTTTERNNTHNLLSLSNNKSPFEKLTATQTADEAHPNSNTICTNKLYSLSHQWQLSNQKHLLSAHKALMNGLHNDAGVYRLTPIADQQSEQTIQMTPQASLVPALMNDLFSWLDCTDQHPLITSCVFHYEFEFIHPFAKGNSEIASFWQTQMLARWSPSFYQSPIETIVRNCKKEYISAINNSTLAGDSVPFIEFMLEMINTSLKIRKKSIKTKDNKKRPHDNPHDKATEKPHENPHVSALINVLKNSENALSRSEIQEYLNLKDRKSFSVRYLKPAIEEGVICMTIPERPKSKSQKYKLI